MAIKVAIHGCDDSTYVTLKSLTKEEITLLKRVASLSKKESSCVCQPTISIEET